MRLEAADDQIFLPGKIHIQRVSEEGRGTHKSLNHMIEMWD